MLKKLQAVCLHHLARYDTTLQYDYELLKQKLSYTEMNCIKLRIGEKTILTSLINLADKCLPLLEDPEMTMKKLRSLMAAKSQDKIYDAHNCFADYIDVAICPLLKQKETEGDIKLSK